MQSRTRTTRHLIDKVMGRPMKYWCLIVMLLLVGAAPVLARPARIILLRHGEKPPDESDVYLTERGKDRARALSAFLTSEPILGTNGLPAALFAPKATKQGHHIRPYQTVAPLSVSN
jgi:hypothetical protein